MYFYVLRIRQDQTQLRKSFESYDPDHYRLFDGEERRYLDPESQKVAKYTITESNFRNLYNLCSRKSKLIGIIFILQLPEVQKLLNTLKAWINDELGKESTRMQVRI